MIQVCNVCGSNDVRQSISFMVNPNTYKGIIVEDCYPRWEDYSYCVHCSDECHLVRAKDCNVESDPED